MRPPPNMMVFYSSGNSGIFRGGFVRSRGTKHFRYSETPHFGIREVDAKN